MFFLWLVYSIQQFVSSIVFRVNTPTSSGAATTGGETEEVGVFTGDTTAHEPLRLSVKLLCAEGDNTINFNSVSTVSTPSSAI